nr:MAG TPA_asm: hypothetical protein [Caudoviricetes sp.]DAZ17769.1 MAG TPA: hypothetical protein [Caudoviricetes sp.]
MILKDRPTGVTPGRSFFMPVYFCCGCLVLTCSAG